MCSQELQLIKQIEEIITNQQNSMLIRKNSFAHLQSSCQSSPQKFTSRPLNYSRQSQLSTLNTEHRYQGLSYEELVEKVHKQESQIQKLTKIIDLYKCKISEFAQYQQVLQEFIKTKEQQKVKSQFRKKQEKDRKFQMVLKSQQIMKLNQKNIHPKIVHVLDYVIESRNDFQSHRQQKSQIQNKTWSSNVSSQFFLQKPIKKQPQIKSQSIQKQRIISYAAPKYVQRDFNESLPQHLEKENMSASQFLLSNIEKQKNLQRIPSLQNMRRMQKCFKLLNS